MTTLCLDKYIKDYDAILNSNRVGYVLVYVFSLKEVYNLFQEICRKFDTLCVSASDTELFKLILPLIESFYYVSPRECIEASECLNNLIDMIRVTTKLSLEDKYVYNIDREQLERVIKELQHLDSSM